MWHVVLLISTALSGSSAQPESIVIPEDRAKAMREVHARYTGQSGTLALFGDSITVSLAFWAPLAYECRNVPPEMERALAVVRGYMRPECWRDWRGPEFGNEGRTTVRWAHEHIGEWLKRLNPETAVIMFGTNDVNDLPDTEYREKLSEVVRRCLDNGTVVILTTPPPKHGQEEKAARFAQIARDIAEKHRVPLIDYHAEIMKRRPTDWDGALETFAGYEVYEVPTLISRDGVHPSNPKAFQNDFSPEGLRSSGYGLRNYLTVLAYAEVIRRILAPESTSSPPGP